MAAVKLDEVRNSLFNFLEMDIGSCLFFFLVGLILRGIPELLVSGYPVGYETITWYAPPMMTFLGRSVGDVFVEFFRSGPLFYVLMWLVTNVTGAHAFLILKVVGPLLYGGLVVSFFVFLRRGLKFDWKVAFVASLLLVFQIAALRDSWDRFRTVLGLGFLFVALTAFKSDHKYKWWLVAVLAVLTVVSREYVAVVLFVVVLGFVILDKKDRVPSLIALGSALAVFAVTIYPLLSGVVWDYVSEGSFVSRGYLWTVQDAFVIFVVCYLGLLPFVVAGWRRDKLMWPMVVFLLVGSFSVLFPFFEGFGYQRWLMLLVFPFCVFAVWGFERLQLFSKRRVWMLAAVILAFIVIGAGYSTGAFSYVGQMTNSYVAVNLMQSSISWDQVGDVKAVLGWLDEHAAFNSSVIVEESFYGWTSIYLKRANEDINVVFFLAGSQPTQALNKALFSGSGWIYLIWFTAFRIENFEHVYSQNGVSVFQYDR